MISNNLSIKEKIFNEYKDIFNNEYLKLFIDNQPFKIFYNYEKNKDKENFIMDYINFENEILDNKTNNEIKKNLEDYSGLKNIGNTCYFNSSLQILYNIPEFYEEIMNFDYNKYFELDEENKIKLEKSFKMVDQIKQLFSYWTIGNLSEYNPTKILENLNDYNNMSYKWGDQKDISEFFLLFLEKIEEVLKTFKKNQNRKEFKEYFFGKNDKEYKNLKLKLFFGEKIIEINNKINNQTEIFQNIMIDINEENIYNLIDKSLTSEDKNKFKYEWINNLPNVINIQLKRFDFDIITKTSVKINDYFKIQEKIDFSRFEYKNKNLVEKIKKDLKNIKLKINEIKNEIEIFDKGIDGTPILKIMENMSKLLKFNKSEIINNMGIHYNKNMTYSKDLNAEKIRLKNELNSKKIILKKLVDEYEHKWDNINNYKNFYEIFAIVIHEGNSIMSGHYYTYIKNFNKWYKFSDSNITEVTKEEVFKVSNGEYSDRSAYSLFYTKTSNTWYLNKDSYKLNLDKQLKLKIKKENNNNKSLMRIRFYINIKYKLPQNINFEDFRIIILKKITKPSNEIYGFLCRKEIVDNNLKEYYLKLSESIYEYNTYYKILEKLKIIDNRTNIINDILDFKELYNHKWIDNDDFYIELISEYKKIVHRNIYYEFALTSFKNGLIYMYISIMKYLLFSHEFKIWNTVVDIKFYNDMKINIQNNLLGVIMHYMYLSKLGKEVNWNQLKLFIKDILEIFMSFENYSLSYFMIIGFLINELEDMNNFLKIDIEYLEIKKKFRNLNNINQNLKINISENELEQIKKNIFQNNNIRILINKFDYNLKKNNFNFDDNLKTNLDNCSENIFIMISTIPKKLQDLILRISNNEYEVINLQNKLYDEILSYVGDDIFVYYN